MTCQLVSSEPFVADLLRIELLASTINASREGLTVSVRVKQVPPCAGVVVLTPVDDARPETPPELTMVDDAAPRLIAVDDARTELSAL